ncbi:MAG: tetratricopeptide repeat protein [Anaerolineales bacterium]
MSPLRRRWTAALCGLLLLLLAALAACGAPQPVAPTVSWLPLPTRAPTPTPLTAEAYLAQVAPALLGGRLEEARVIWEEAYARAPDDPKVLREGARLALVLNDLETAAERAQEAITAAPEDARGWMILGIVYQHQGDLGAAQAAYQEALTLDPAAGADLFAARWQIARRQRDAVLLTQLAQEYLMRHPDDPLALYYRSTALMAGGYEREALELLLLQMESDAPAAVWYTLGRAYLAYGSGEEALIALETASDAYARGDKTLLLASDDPQYDLYALLGRALIEAQRCQEVDTRLLLLTTPYPDLIPLVEEARQCPTPTPTATPWLPWDEIPPSTDDG